MGLWMINMKIGVCIWGLTVVWNTQINKCQWAYFVLVLLKKSPNNLLSSELSYFNSFVNFVLPWWKIHKY